MSNAKNIEAKIARAGFAQVAQDVWVRGAARIEVLCNPPMDGMREVVGMNVCRTSEQADLMTDYFPGAWFKSATKALAHAAWINGN